MFHYQAFHLSIQSDLRIPELQESTPTDIPDIVIKSGEGKDMPTSTAHLIYSYESGLKFWVNKGKEIIYTNPAQHDERIVSTHLLDYPLIGLLYQRGFIAIHGSCIVLDAENAIIITGHSGAGKSTTAGLFRKKGYKILADEICAIRQHDDGLFYVYPSYPEVGLWADSIEMINDPQLLKQRRSRFGLDNKFDCAVSDSFYEHIVPVKVLFCLYPTEGGVSLDISVPPSPEPLTGIAAMHALRENSLNYLSSVEQFGFLNSYFMRCATLCQQVPIFQLGRLQLKKQLFPTADIIESFVEKYLAIPVKRNGF